MRFTGAAFLSAVFLLSAAFVVFGNGGTLRLIQKGAHWSTATAAAQPGDAVKEWNQAIARSPLHQICSRTDCDRPAILERSYEGGTVLYFCDQHRSPNRLISEIASLHGFFNDENGNSYNTLKEPPGGPTFIVTVSKGGGLVRGFLWAMSLGGLGLCVIAVIAFFRLEKARTALILAGATLALAGVFWLLAYGYAAHSGVS
jgi:hypothetical protein